MSTDVEPEVIVAFDYGERRIGVATGNCHTATATPIGVLACRNGFPQWNEMDQLLTTWAPDALIVGSPPGGNVPLLEKIANFVQALKNRYKLPVHLVDEADTSQAAEAALVKERHEGTRKKRIKRGDIDELAATIIAQRWLAGDYPDD